jgi:hypothetical protein
MQQRELITLLGGVSLTWPLAMRAQQPDRMRRVGVLVAWPEGDPEAKSPVEAFHTGLQNLGWIVGRSIRIDYR